MDATREFLRHTVATLAYRAAKAMRDAPHAFSDCRIAETSRTAGQILAHIGDLMDWALSMAEGRERWRNSTPQTWDADVARVTAGFEAFDAFLRSDQPLMVPTEKLFQGPVADALTHVGQIAMLRRVAASPVRGENYFKANIAAGRVGLDQAPPVREFD